MRETFRRVWPRIARSDERDLVRGSGGAEEKNEKVLFVCTANVCRSPMAEAIFNALAEDEGLSVRAESAGVVALVGEGMAPKASIVLEEAGIYPGEHRARQVSKTMLDEANLVLVMGPQHKAELHRLFGDSLKQVYTLPEYASGSLDGNHSGEGEIPDPYGHTMTAYRASLRQLYDYIERLLERLER